MSNLAELVAEFRQHGYKMTPQRRAIIETITGCTSQHPTAEQIHERVTARMPDISLATVYNTLRELVSIGRVYELNLGQSMRRYELTRDKHAHLVCLDCGTVRDVAVDVSRLESMVPAGNGFRPARHEITVYGHCAACADTREG
jgi:Fe2+ or Zn2+ uptake regulation protein